MHIFIIHFALSNALTSRPRHASRTHEFLLHLIGTPGVAEWIETTGTTPVIEPDKLEALARAYELCAKTVKSVAESLPEGSARIAATTLVGENMDLLPDTPASRRLANLIGKLNDEEMIDLLACGWFGPADLPTWRESFEHTERTFTTLAPRDPERSW